MIGRQIRAEIFKVGAYRTPALAALTALAILALWAFQIMVRDASYGESGFLSSMLGMTGTLLPIVAFLLPILLIEADSREGTLNSVFAYVPRPEAVLSAKWAASVFAGLISVVLMWVCIVTPLLAFYGQADALVTQLPVLGRMCFLMIIWISCGAAVEILTGHKGPWVILCLLVWIHLIERLLGSSLPGTGGMLVVPFRLADFWLRGDWARIDPWGYDWAGVAPMAAYTFVIVVAAVLVFLRFSDASGRTWGRKNTQ